jgi:hypothetical protein
VGVAAAVASLAFGARGGQDVGPVTWAELALVLTAGLLVALAVVLAPRPARAWGAGAAALLGVLAIWTALSVAWSIVPSESWVEANRTFGYLAALAVGIALARLGAGRPWVAGGLLAGIAGAALAVAGWALLTKVFPGGLDSGELFARLREPFGYWNAVGLMAALGVPGALWLAARREGPPVLAALGLAAMGVLFLCALLAYSRGALIALAVGLVPWFALAPVRLRSVAAVFASGLAAGLAAWWAFGQDGLTKAGAPAAERAAAGHRLGLVLLGLVVVLVVAGWALRRRADHSALAQDARRRAGWVAAAAVVLAVLGGALGAIRVSGGVSAAWHGLTSPAARVSSDDPSRLASTASARGRYWHEARLVWGNHRWRGSGAGAFATARGRYSVDETRVAHAHGYVSQTLADLGVIGLLASLAGFGALAVAAARPLRARSQRPWEGERLAALGLAATALSVGAHSLIDWTWFVPATAVAGFACAGWLAGRGPLAAALGSAPPRSAARLLAAAGVLAVAVAGAWSMLGPARAERSSEDALTALARGDVAAARAAALRADGQDPLSPEPLWTFATVEAAAGRPAVAASAVRRALDRTPEDVRAWTELARFELDVRNRPEAALAAVSRGARLSPHDSLLLSVQFRAQRALAASARAPSGGEQQPSP